MANGGIGTSDTFDPLKQKALRSQIISDIQDQKQEAQGGIGRVQLPGEISQDINAEDFLSQPLSDEEAAEINLAGRNIFELTRRDRSLPLERLTFQENFPAAALGTRVANVQGRIIGSQPIFSGATLFPFGVTDARQRAIQSAVNARLKGIEDLKTLFPAIPKGPAQFQRKISNGVIQTANAFFDRAIAETKGDPITARQNLQNPFTQIGRDFKTSMENYNVLARELEFLDSNSQTVFDDASKGRTVPKPAFDAAMVIKTGQLDVRALAENPSILADARTKLRSYGNLVKFINDDLNTGRINLEELVSEESVNRLSTQPDFDINAIDIKEVIDQDRLINIATQVKASGGGDILESTEEIAKYIESLVVGNRQQILKGQKFNLAARQALKRTTTGKLTEDFNVKKNFVSPNGTKYTTTAEREIVFNPKGTKLRAEATSVLLFGIGEVDTKVVGNQEFTGTSVQLLPVISSDKLADAGITNVDDLISFVGATPRQRRNISGTLRSDEGLEQFILSEDLINDPKIAQFADFKWFVNGTVPREETITVGERTVTIEGKTLTLPGGREKKQIVQQPALVLFDDFKAELQSAHPDLTDDRMNKSGSAGGIIPY